MSSTTSSLLEFKVIYEDYFDNLCKQAYRVLNDSEKSRDCVQRVFVKVWEKKLYQDPELNLENYLYRSVKNEAISEYRKSKRAQNNEDTVKGNFLLWNDEDTQTPEDLALIRNRLKRSIINLKPKMQKIFMMHFKDGLTHVEISEFLEIPKRTVEDNISRAYKLIKSDLTNDKTFMETHFASLGLLLPFLFTDSLNAHSIQIKSFRNVVSDFESVLISVCG